MKEIKKLETKINVKMGTKLIKLDATEFGVDKSRAKEMESAFVPMINFLKEMEVEYNGITKKSQGDVDKELCLKAHTLRLKYVKSRTGVDVIHRKGKQEVLLLGRAWDSLKNQYLYITNQNEETLGKIEMYFEIREDERKAILKEQREKLLKKYEVETEHIQLGEMEEDVWGNYFSGVKLQYENAITAEKKAETDRITKEKAEKAEQERIRKDNERLQKEAEEREEAMQVVIRQEEAKRKTIEEQARKERESSEAKAKIEAESKAKIKAELQAKKDAEVKAETDKQAAIESELSKGDKEKFESLIYNLEELKTKHSFKSKKYRILQTSINGLIDKIIIYSRSKLT